MKQFNYRAAFNIIIIGILMMIAEALKAQSYSTNYKLIETKETLQMKTETNNFQFSESEVIINGNASNVQHFFKDVALAPNEKCFVYMTENNFYRVITLNGTLKEIAVKGALMSNFTRYYPTLPTAFKYVGEIEAKEIRQFDSPFAKSDEDKRR